MDRVWLYLSARCRYERRTTAQGNASPISPVRSEGEGERREGEEVNDEVGTYGTRATSGVPFADVHPTLAPRDQPAVRLRLVFYWRAVATAGAADASQPTCARTWSACQP